MNTPVVSVIIPTYNRPSSLQICLESLFEQDADSSSFEVIVVNDGGSDITHVIESFTFFTGLRQILQTNAGPASARNHGARLASGTFLAFLDDDCTPRPDWISSIIRHAQKGTLIGGKVINRLDNNLFAETCQTLIDFLYLHLAGSSDLFFTSNNLIIASSDFQRIGGFDTGFRTSAGEDRELCIRAERRGLELIHIPEIRIGHSHDMDLMHYMKLHTKYGRATHTYRKALAKLPHANRSAPSGFYRGLLLYPFRANLRSPWIQTALLALSQVCTFWGYLLERYGNHK
jgi:glycosyltransferase involved in cell wall biosynthesis